MTDQALCSVLEAPAPLAQPRRYRDQLPGAPRPDISIPLGGALDHESRGRLMAVIAGWGNVTPVVSFASVAHVDLTDVTRLEAAGVDQLNELHARLTGSGWLLRVTPPADIDARLAFHNAVIHSELRWV